MCALYPSAVSERHTQPILASAALLPPFFPCCVFPGIYWLAPRHSAAIIYHLNWTTSLFLQRRQPTTSHRTSNMSDYESDDEGQPIERRPRRRHADRGNMPISNHHQQRTHPIRPQVHHQMQAQMQPAQRKFTCKVHPGTETDV
jgi:hypothetical protein